MQKIIGSAVCVEKNVSFWHNLSLPSHDRKLARQFWFAFLLGYEADFEIRISQAEASHFIIPYIVHKKCIFGIFWKIQSFKC